MKRNPKIRIVDALHVTCTATFHPKSNTMQVISHDRPSSSSHITDTLAAMFLPEGYPDSVPSDYLAFQMWDTIQALCSYVRGVLSSNALLTGVGVGSTTANALSATAAFVVKDLTGMLGSILFSYWQGAKLDADEKQWRLFADGMNNVGLALELASPQFPSMFMLMACMGSIARAITGAAGAATRAAMTHHFAQQYNAADIAAKECSQETATVLVGMLVGLVVAHAAQGRPVVAWGAFLVLMVLHMVANVRAVRCLELRNVNRTRADIVIYDFIHSKGKHVPTPRDVAACEPLLPPPIAAMVYWTRRWILIRHPPSKRPLSFGVALAALQNTTVVAGIPVEEQSSHSSSVRRRSTRRGVGSASPPRNTPAHDDGDGPPPALLPYIITQHSPTSRVLVALQDKIEGAALLQAYAHARLIAMGDATHTAWLLQHWDGLLKKMRAAGWDLERVHLAPGQQRWRSTHDE